MTFFFVFILEMLWMEMVEICLIDNIFNHIKTLFYINLG